MLEAGDVVLIKIGGYGFNDKDIGKYCILKSKITESMSKTGFKWQVEPYEEPFVTVNPCDVWGESFGDNPLVLHNINDPVETGFDERTDNKYLREIKKGVFVDVYDVLQAWAVTNPALQHLIKKALACGQRGHKDELEDYQDIIDSSIRAKQLYEESSE